jgi:acyl-CoA synthetase (NDP forming)
MLDLDDERETAAACAALAARLARAGAPLAGFLVQEMARGGHETIFGISTDERYGPVLMFGLGGKYVEVFRDVRFGVPPMTATDAREMVRGIRGARLLEGVRGEAGADVELLAEILLRLAQLVESRPEIVELDVNPFLAADRAASRALDVRVRRSPDGRR